MAQDMTKWCKTCTFGARSNPDRCFMCLCHLVTGISRPSEWNKKVR